MLRIVLSLVPVLLSSVIITTEELYPDQLHAKFATPCKTPNDDFGVCIEVQKCSVFIEAILNSKNESFEFILASRCGPKNENVAQPKVCCGAHPDFLNKTYARTTTTARSKKKQNSPFPRSCGNHTLTFSPRIFGGQSASLGEYPWMARLLHRRKDNVYNYGCAGFLISKYFVLTAAHCIVSKALMPLGPVHQVQLGEHDTRFNPDCEDRLERKVCAPTPQLLKAAKPIVHPEYVDNIQQRHDIALIPLKEAANLTAYVYPICLGMENTEESEMWLSGWGKTETRESSGVKLKVAIQRANQTYCSNVYRNVGVRLDESQLCAGGTAGIDSCTGDSGGPLMIQRGIEPWQAEGIVSFGMGCGLEGWPGIYTNIPFYMPWIRKRMNRYLKNHDIDYDEM